MLTNRFRRQSNTTDATVENGAAAEDQETTAFIVEPQQPSAASGSTSTEPVPPPPYKDQSPPSYAKPDSPASTKPDSDPESTTTTTTATAPYPVSQPTTTAATTATVADPDPRPTATTAAEESSRVPPVIANIMGNTGGMAVCICGVAVAVAAVIMGFIIASIHTVEEGYVGVYYKYGAMLDAHTLPGMHMKDPVATTMVQVMIRPETDKLPSMQASTQDGITILFDDIQVISRVNEAAVTTIIKRYGRKFKHALVFDRVREELRIFCANNTVDDVYNHRFLDIVDEVRKNVVATIKRLASGQIEILNLVISKPDIPNDIADNYKQVKVQWTEQLVAKQKQATDEIKLKTEELRAIANAKRQKAVLEITLQEKLLQKEGEQNVSRLNNDIIREQEENLANIEKFKKETAAAANKALYSKEYVQLQMALALANNTKFYFSGETSPLGGLLAKVMN